MPPRKRAAKKSPAKAKSHTVQPGETLADVARALGVTEDRVRQANGLRHDLLAHGTTLRA